MIRSLTARYRQVVLISLSFIVGIGGLAPMVVSAANSQCPPGISTLDCNALYGPWVDWQPVGTTCTATLSSISLLGSDKIEQTYNFFVQHGFSPAAAAGITGNAMEESEGINPERSQRTQTDETAAQMFSLGLVNIPPNNADAWGTFQWDPPSDIINPLMAAHKDPNDLATQLQFLVDQLNSNPSYFLLPQLKAATTPQQAADIFEQGFERAGSPALSVRESDAIQVYQRYGNNGVTAGGVVAASNPAGNSCGSTSTGQTTKFVGNVPVYSQCDPAWTNTSYDGGTLCENGCGPSAMAMIISALTGQQVTPVDVATFYSQNGYTLPAQKGTTFDAAPAAAQHWSLTPTLLGNSVAKISATLSTGGLVIMAGTGPAPFTTQGHFIAIVGISGSQWVVADSGTGTVTNYDPAAVINAGAAASSVYAITK